MKRKKKKNNCNLLIRLHNFVKRKKKHDYILRCALRLKFIRKTFTMLKQAFQELGW